MLTMTRFRGHDAESWLLELSDSPYHTIDGLSFCFSIIAEANDILGLEMPDNSEVALIMVPDHSIWSSLTWHCGQKKVKQLTLMATS